MTAPTDSAIETASARRERLILENLPQVRLVARRIHERLPATISLDDLISAGTLGLISAIDGFREEEGVKLRTYAEHKIRGAILDSLRDLDWAPRSQRRRARSVQKATAALEQRNMEHPSAEQIADELGISLAECWQWLNDARAMAFTSLDAPLDSEEAPRTLQFAADERTVPGHGLEQMQLRELLEAGIRRMPLRERTVLSLIYQEELTLREIAQVMGLHESRISQLKNQGLGRLRTMVGRTWPGRGETKKGPGRVRAASAAAAALPGSPRES